MKPGECSDPQMALTDTAIKNAKPKATQYKLHDEKGLFAIVRPTGGRLWRFKYRYQGKEQQLSLGTYSKVSLKDARQRRDEVIDLLTSADFARAILDLIEDDSKAGQHVVVGNPLRAEA